MKKILIEACVNGVESAIEAEKGGAQRIELCDNLYEGGTTPSISTVSLARKYCRASLFVIIRPRGGDFMYNDLEFEIMKEDIRAVKEAGADGVVIGILNRDGSVDKERTKVLLNLARPMEVTFHRAFDMVNDPFQALEDLIAIGVDRVLTSGNCNKAIDGKELIRKLISESKGRIQIMPGSGIDEHNIETLISATGADQFHVSCRSSVESKMQFRRDNVYMGGLSQIPEFEKRITDVNRISQVVKKANKINR